MIWDALIEWREADRDWREASADKSDYTALLLAYARLEKAEDVLRLAVEPLR